MTKRIVLIGKPVSHSISPAFQQAALDYCGLDVVYERCETEPESVEETVHRLAEPGCLGANVTVPHKQAVMPFLDAIDNQARAVGAVNTIVNGNGRLTGYNTDIAGFARALSEQKGISLRGKHALVLGAGGAARAVVMALLRARLTVTVVNRTFDKASALVEDLSQFAGPSQLNAAPYDHSTLESLAPHCMLVVNCTSVGMKNSATEGESPFPAALIQPQSLVFDIIANPLETKLLQDAIGRGALTVNGLSMLVYQGAASFELWTGKPAPVDVMMDAAHAAMGVESALKVGD